MDLYVDGTACDKACTIDWMGVTLTLEAWLIVAAIAGYLIGHYGRKKGWL